MPSLRLHCTRAITFALLMTNAYADVILLKSGEKIEGKVIKETDKELTVEVKVSASIKDERVIPRTDIERIETVQPETEAYRQVAAIQTPLNSLAASQYDTLVAPLRAYLTQYPNSTHAKDAQKALDEILAEKARVEGGEIKLRGEWMSKEVAEKEKVQINGMLALEHMKNQSSTGDSIGALNTFATIEKNYAGSASMPEGIELARSVMASMKPVLDRAVADQKAFKEQKEKGFASAGPAERAEMMAAYKAEVAQADKVVAAAETAQQWPPFLPTNEKSIKALIARVGRELPRLEKLPVDKMKASLQMTTVAQKKIAEGELEEAANTLKEATKLWTANELANRLSKDVAAQIKAAPPKDAPVATPEPATPKPAATPRPSAAVRTAAPLAAEEPKSFFMTLPGAISIVVGIAAILVGVNVFKKMKARNSEPVE
jgi:hypothetical protein